LSTNRSPWTDRLLGHTMFCSVKEVISNTHAQLGKLLRICQPRVMLTQKYSKSTKNTINSFFLSWSHKSTCNQISLLYCLMNLSSKNCRRSCRMLNANCLHWNTTQWLGDSTFYLFDLNTSSVFLMIFRK